jgi:hypothetical protein
MTHTHIHTYIRTYIHTGARSSPERPGELRMCVIRTYIHTHTHPYKQVLEELQNDQESYVKAAAKEALAKLKAAP